MSAGEVADLLKVEKQWVYKATRSGRIPHIKVGRHYRYRREAILAWAEEEEASSIGLDSLS